MKAGTTEDTIKDYDMKYAFLLVPPHYDFLNRAIYIPKLVYDVLLIIDTVVIVQQSCQTPFY